MDASSLCVLISERVGGRIIARHSTVRKEWSRKRLIVCQRQNNTALRERKSSWHLNKAAAPVPNERSLGRRSTLLLFWQRNALVPVGLLPRSIR